MVGEIRDKETALEAIRASQTGHVVLSTLHSNDAVDALQRIYDLGIHPNSIASELLAVIAQRLARRICPHCRQSATPDPEILAEVFPKGVPAGFQCYEVKGCKKCKGLGTKGRVAVIEYMEVNLDIRYAISSQPSVTKLRRLALDAGLVTMRDSALDHVIAGLIPLSELPRILPRERMAPEARGEVGG
jgi:type IV pilus assembly protein PilB